MLELRDVSRSLGKEPLLVKAGMDFSRDAPTAVLGLHPAAREAFLRLLAGADKPQAGSIRLNGREIASYRRSKGVIVRIGGPVKPSKDRVGKLVAQEAAERVRLGGRLNAMVGDLDPDQRLRLSVAIALTGRPALILLDAPGDGLGPQARERFIADLKPMLAETGAVVVLAAGAADEAMGLGGLALVLDRGKIVQSGDVRDVFAYPANLAAALATSRPGLNTLFMSVRGRRGVLRDGSTFEPPVDVALPSQACTIAFRPEAVAFERKSASCLRFVARAMSDENVAGQRYLRVAFADASWLAPLYAQAPPPGVLLNLFVDRAGLMLFDSEGLAAAP